MNNNNELEVNNEAKPESKKINEEKLNKDKIEDNPIQKHSEKEILQNKLKIYKIQLGLLKEKYSKENLSRELDKKKKELEIINVKEQIESNSYELEREKKNLQEEIKNNKSLLKSITVTFKKYDREFDGLFISTKEFVLENSLDDKITIHANSLVIVEVKNYDNYHDMSLNLEKKKSILESIGFPVDKIYFVGILRSLDEFKKLSGQIKGLNKKNMIIVYPDKTTFLNIPLFDKKIEEKVEEKKKEKLEDKMENLEVKMEKLFNMIGQLTNKITDMDFKMSNMNTKINNINTEISDMNTEMKSMRSDIDILKNKIK